MVLICIAFVACIGTPDPNKFMCNIEESVCKPVTEAEEKAVTAKCAKDPACSAPRAGMYIIRDLVTK